MVHADPSSPPAFVLRFRVEASMPLASASTPRRRAPLRAHQQTVSIGGEVVTPPANPDQKTGPNAACVVSFGPEKTPRDGLHPH